MTIRKFALLCTISFAFALAGCSSKYRTDNHQVIETVAPGSSFYIMLPKDGIFGEINYMNSGQMLSNEVYRRLLPYSETVYRAENVEDLEEAFVRAAEKKLDFLIDPEILHWEDRATEWSGRPDRITIKYQAYQVDDKMLLVTSTLSASSKWATFGGDHPVDLLPVPTKQFVSSLLGKHLDIEQ
ncbi:MULTISPECIES: DUF4823 domain-containing protein [unclassified Thalassospira]|uniref:DUF4823 domain-containing protein n=1 Tax=unclassified Thalassospira TaxID=2648997 RepID=UPI0007A63E2F|nr:MULTISPECIES: DUF4823 domain-containing protein [unclassified Thalassospira]KZD00924.1 hypothetical protein AUQ41_04020 [Thalassospira sp. MCCC 1A02898]ONH87370.1 hypothetical protein TH47_06505 [Thalassospira sp. MCCC 1A02803]